MPSSTRAHLAARWSALVVALGVVWLTTAQPVPLYDGIGFPDEPYRFVPPRSTTAPAATTAEVELKVVGGANAGGLIVNSRESGPQVTVYAPPRAFAAPGTAPIKLSVRPVAPTPPLPAGTLDSNVYALTLSSAAGPVGIVTAAQSPTITMRAVEITPTLPDFRFRPSPSEEWRELKTRRIGRDNFNATVPGPGEYVLVQAESAASPSSRSRAPLYAVLGATVILMALVLVGVRVMSRRASEEQSGASDRRSPRP